MDIVRRRHHTVLPFVLLTSTLSMWPVRGHTVEAPAQTSGPARVRVERDIPYVPGATPDQRLDLYTPSSSGFRTVVFMHGGSLQESGERRSSPMYAHVCDAFAARNIGCATIDYRLAPSYRWPAMPEDAAAAVKWVRTHIAERGGDASKIFLFGHSSGCHLAATLGANPKYLAAVDLQPKDLAGVIAMGCVLSPLEEVLSRMSVETFTERWARGRETSMFASAADRLDSDPSRFIGDHTPPMLVVCARAERFFPAILEQGAKFVRRLLEMNRPADLVIVPGKHVTSIQDITQPGNQTLAAILAFLDHPETAGLDSR